MPSFRSRKYGQISIRTHDATCDTPSFEATVTSSVKDCDLARDRSLYHAGLSRSEPLSTHPPLSLPRSEEKAHEADYAVPTDR